MIFYYYKIINQQNNNCYIGITENWKRREKEHFSHLKNNNHANYKLQRDWNEGFTFTFNVIEERDFENEILAYNYEKELIDKNKPFYNIAVGGKINPMYTKEIREKMTKTKQTQVENIVQLEKISDKPLHFKILKEWNSAKEVQKHTHFSQANISRACNRESISSNGYYWVYKKDILEWKPKQRWNCSPIAVLNDREEIINVFIGASEASKTYNIKSNNIVNVLRNGKGKTNGICFKKISLQEYYDFVDFKIINLSACID